MKQFTYLDICEKTTFSHYCMKKFTQSDTSGEILPLMYRVRVRIKNAEIITL